MPRTKALTTEERAALPRFARWIEAYGARRLAEALGVSVYSVYGWRRGAVNLAEGRPFNERGGTRPDPDKLPAIIALAKGQLKASDIYPAQKQEAATA